MAIDYSFSLHLNDVRYIPLFKAFYYKTDIIPNSNVCVLDVTFLK